MKQVRAVLDTNTIILVLLFGGPPQIVLQLATLKEIHVITSPLLLAELAGVLINKFKFNQDKALGVEKKIRRLAVLVHPTVTITVLKDAADNRVLEAAQEGECAFIVTGDKALLKLSTYKGIQIVSSQQFLTKINVNSLSWPYL